jgi:hypothetical protein
MRQLRRKKKVGPAPTTERASKLSGTRRMHVDVDDDRPTREDVEADKASKRPGSISAPSGPLF